MCARQPRLGGSVTSAGQSKRSSHSMQKPSSLSEGRLVSALQLDSTSVARLPAGRQAVPRQSSAEVDL